MSNDNFEPLDSEKTLYNTSPDEGEASLGDLRTLGGDSAGGEQSIGDLPTGAPSGGAARPSEGFEGVALSERYEIIGEIGRGGFAVVYKARDKRLRREVVVKRLHFGEAGMGDETIRRRFEHEAHAIATLNHPSIIQVYDYDRDAEGHYIVMEYVPDGSLRDLIKREGRLEVQETVRIIRQVCQGLAFAHRKNLVHRDIKPANILMQGGNAKIADFGLARAGFETGMSMSLSMSGTSMGTPYYMPPEQREDAKKVNHTADIYAVGKTLYQLVTGDIPDNVDPDLIPSPELARIIFKCVKTRPEDRYFSMEELIDALDGIEGPEQAKAMENGNVHLGAETVNACPSCDRGCSDAELYCGGCGESLARECPECGVKNSKFRKFCNGCGTDIEGAGHARESSGRREDDVRCDIGSTIVSKSDLVESPGSEFAPLNLTCLCRKKRVFGAGYREHPRKFSLASGSAEAQERQKKVINEKGFPLEANTRAVGIAFRLVPAGSFLMGSLPGEKGRSYSEIRHKIPFMNSFYCGKFPVTQSQWRRVMGNNPSLFNQGPNAPVDSISWEDCQVFLKKLCDIEKVPQGTYRLLTEAQWEYACRAGTQTPFCFGDQLDSTMANFDGNFPYGGASKGPYRQTTTPVGQFISNAWGIYDMHGNVWEWCDVGGPNGVASDSYRVRRGGSWFSRAKKCRSAARIQNMLDSRYDDLGFRIMRVINENYEESDVN